MKIIEYIVRIPEFIYRKKMSRKLKLGYMAYIQPPIYVIGEERIKIGAKFAAMPGVRLETYDNPYAEKDIDTPVLTIGNNVCLNYRTHVGAINSVIIDDGVLTGTDVVIVDHNHGNTKNIDELLMAPRQRKLYSKGSIRIGKNVWIGDKACILPGVTIGEGAIIGAAAVVTHDIPPFSIAIGNPARVVSSFHPN